MAPAAVRPGEPEYARRLLKTGLTASTVVTTGAEPAGLSRTPTVQMTGMKILPRSMFPAWNVIFIIRSGGRKGRLLSAPISCSGFCAEFVGSRTGRQRERPRILTPVNRLCLSFFYAKTFTYLLQTGMNPYSDGTISGVYAFSGGHRLDIKDTGIPT